MLRSLLAFSVLAVALHGCAPAGLSPEADPSPEAGPLASVEIFRYADLGRAGRVVLGETFAQRADLGIKQRDGGHLLRGRYADTGGITVYVDSRNVVTGIRFDYDPAGSLAALVDDYTRALGPPTGGSRLGHTQRVEWWDGATRFTLVSRTSDRPALYSVLSDE